MIRAAAALVAITLSAAVYAQGSRLERPGFNDLSPESRRTIFVTEYEELFDRARPDLNFIKASIRRVKGGHFLYVTHPLFHRHMFDSGPLGRTVQSWLARYQWQLKNAGITRVGFRTPDGEEVWFKL